MHGQGRTWTISRIQSYIVGRISLCTELTEKLGNMGTSATAVAVFLNQDFKWEWRRALFCFQGNVINFSSMCPIFAIQLNISFVLGNVYFDVKSWGKRYGVLTTINPDTQDEAGKFVAPACVC